MKEGIMKEFILKLLLDAYKKFKSIELKIVDTPKDIVTEGDVVLGKLIREECLGWPFNVCICTEEYNDKIKNCDEPEYYIFVDELDGTDNAFRGPKLFPSSTLIQVAKATAQEDIKFQDFIAVGAVEHSRGEVYIAIKGEGIEKYSIDKNNVLKKEEIIEKHPKQEVAITDLYSMRNETNVIQAFASAMQLKDFGASAATYCYVATGLFEAYASSNKKGNELPLLYRLCKEAGLVMKDFSGNDYDEIKYNFNACNYQVVAGKKETCKKLLDSLNKSDSTKL